jgi:SHS2 domain-containing protein
MENKSGYLEIEHTADWALKVWAENLPGLFYEATKGMNYLTGTEVGAFAGERRIRAAGMDAETLLVNYLTELVLLGEEERLMIEPAAPTIKNFEIDLVTSIYRIKKQEKEIKAVTYHKLEVNKVSSGFETTIVFDV